MVLFELCVWNVAPLLFQGGHLWCFHPEEPANAEPQEFFCGKETSGWTLGAAAQQFALSHGQVARLMVIHKPTNRANGPADLKTTMLDELCHGFAIQASLTTS